MADPNFADKTIWTGDNLDILRGMNSGCVDLIYLDPPFNSNRDYAAPIGSEEAEVAFKDTWYFSDLDAITVELLDKQHPAVKQAIVTAGLTHGKGMQAYLCMMAVRLLEMHRVLKDTGSLYLHCDDAANSYLRLLLDAIFGPQQRRNELIWRRATSHNDPARYGRILDHILYYVKSNRYHWDGDAIRTTKTDDQLHGAYPKTDDRGRYRSDNLTGPRHNAERGSPSTLPWRGYDVYARGRVWSAPKTGRYAAYIEQHFIPGYRSIAGVHERLDALDAAGLIYHPPRGTWPGLKRYAAADTGNPPQTLILEPTGFTNYSKGRGEWIDYPTQKPLALLERIIAASSKEEDMVLDPFCGCATTLIAAEKLGRSWVGIDLSPKAAHLVKQRLAESPAQLRGARQEAAGLVTARTDIPRRTDRAPPPPLAQQKRPLYGKQEGYCAGCRVHFQARHLEIDHVLPRSRGGTNHLDNLQLLCGSCNRIKGNRPQEYLLARLRELGLR